MNWMNAHWLQISVIGLATHTFLKAVRDAVDKTPNTDDNAFERLVTISGKAVGYLFGSRPK